jgi:NAD(P)-dependent dehydrogenase (short-subunit alcohol dehydrogenase family)
MRHEPSRIVLVTGASRGIGAEVARQLANPDTHVLVNYRERDKRANAIVDAIRAAGGHASTLAADISDETDAAAMIDAIAARFGRLDTLILNASGGLELGAEPGYAMRLNRDAQRRLVQLAMPLMPVGGRIVYVTSHQAHFFPHKAVPKGYSAVAASKRAGETALYAMRSEFEHAGIHFTVVSGDMVDGTFIPAAIVGAANRPNPSGVVYVGGANYLMTA